MTGYDWCIIRDYAHYTYTNEAGQFLIRWRHIHHVSSDSRRTLALWYDLSLLRISDDINYICRNRIACATNSKGVQDMKFTFTTGPTFALHFITRYFFFQSTYMEYIFWNRTGKNVKLTLTINKYIKSPNQCLHNLFFW